MSDKFMVGDVVRVYGVPGPRMVVSKIISDAKGVLIRCFWFNRRNEFVGQDFGPSFLCRATPWEHREREEHHVEELEKATLEETADAGD